MNRFILSLFILLALPGFALAEFVKLPLEQQKIFADASSFREIHASSNLPPAVVKLCADENGRFAEPGRRWNPTDVIIDKNVPRSRLIWGATNGSYYVIHYECGGDGHTFEILIVSMKPDAARPTVIFHGYSVGLLKDYKAFVQVMEAGRLISRD